MDDADWITPSELAALRGSTPDAARKWIARRAREGAETREVRSRHGRPTRLIHRDAISD